MHLTNSKKTKEKEGKDPLRALKDLSIKSTKDTINVDIALAALVAIPSTLIASEHQRINSG